MEGAPLETVEFIEDDNRGAVAPEPLASFGGVDFHLSVKGVGSAADPYSSRPLDRTLAAQLTSDPDVRRRLLASGSPQGDRMITGELWLRGSPYGGQGLQHARTALAVSERAELTSLAGFLIAPVVKVCFLPEDLQARLRTLHWYREYTGPIVQELRLVPSNIRIYFHSKTTVGQDVRHVFDLFKIDTNEKALQFELNFIRSGLAMLTLFPRTLRREGERYTGLDFHDVWMDKDAVMAPNGSVFFVDLEGIEPVSVAAAEVVERVEDQIFRSLYEFTFAYEQVDEERRRRFGEAGTRKGRFATLLAEALKDDPYVRLHPEGAGLAMSFRNPAVQEVLNMKFQMVS